MNNQSIIFVISLFFIFSLMLMADSNEEAQSLSEEAKKIRLPIKMGGSLRANYVYGDYTGRRGEKMGDVDFDTFSLAVNLEHNNIIGKIEYRWYDTYSMIHTAWLGYDFGEFGTIKAGVVRVPFGPGPYGVSSSWFFDQHYYVGLSDDMDFGIRWTRSLGNLTLDFAYFLQDEGNWDGESVDSARYSYDPVRWDKKVDVDGNVHPLSATGANGFEEQHQFNLRVIYAIEKIGEFGTSLQYGKLKGTNVDDSDADHYALSAHTKNILGDFTLMSQITYYTYDIPDDTPWGTGDLLPMGAFDFPWLVASKGYIPALSLRYNGIDTSGISWLDSVTPYIEWSSIMKRSDDFNDSSLWVIGAAWSSGGWFIYTDLGCSNGNPFVGSEGDNYENIYAGVGDHGANGNNKWNIRFNINLGYYF